MEIVDKQLIVPAGTAGDRPTTIDLDAILTSEKRQGEIAFVTPQKAPELLAEFNKAWRDIHMIVTSLTAQKLKAEKAVAKRRATLLLEVVPGKLKELDISNAADNREAVIALDSEHEVLEDIVNQISAAIEMFKGKLKGCENAFTSVKKIMGEDTYNMAGRGPNRSLSGDTSPAQRMPAASTPTTAPARTPVTPTAKTPRPGFGIPRYGSGSNG